MKFNTVFVEFIPDELADKTLYISEKYQTVIHLCPCGCREHVVTPTSGSHKWGYSKNEQGITLSPSIGNFQQPCKSHYHITDSTIMPCSDWILNDTTRT